MGEGCNPKIEFDWEYLWIDDNYCNTLTCFEITLWPRMECTTSSHEMGYIEDMESLNDFQHMDEEFFIEDHIMKHLKEISIDVIIGELPHDMIVMSFSQYIIFPHEPNEFLEEDSFSEYSQNNSYLYAFDEVCFQPMIFSHDTFFFQFDY